MDRQTELAINELWTRGIDAINKRIEKLESTVDRRFAELESEKRWRFTQFIFVAATLIAFLIDIFTRQR